MQGMYCVMSSTLRALSEHRRFPIGAAIFNEDAFLADADYRQFHADHFNLLVLESAMTCHRICAHPNRYDFSPADALVDFPLNTNKPCAVTSYAGMLAMPLG